MQYFKSFISIFLVLLMLMIHGGNVFAAQSGDNEKDTITIHDPKSRTSAVKNMPGKGGNAWLWVIIGAVVIAGGAAAAAGGGGDSGSGGSDSPTQSADTGSISGSW